MIPIAMSAIASSFEVFIVAAPVLQALLSQPVAADRFPKSRSLQYPHGYRDHHYHVQNCFDAAGHGDEAIDQPQRHAHHNQRDHDIYQRHFVYSSPTTCAIRGPYTIDGPYPWSISQCLVATLQRSRKLVRLVVPE